MNTSSLIHRGLPAALAGVALSTSLAVSEASASVALCVPKTAGQTAFSGGTNPATYCAGAQTMIMPDAVTDQQKLVDMLPYLEFKAAGIGGKPTITVKGANLQIVNGSGATDNVNGTGNLVLGYNELSPAQTGSHSLAIGKGNAFTSYGSIVAGYYQKASGAYSSAVGGRDNQASGFASAVIGGIGNQATSEWTTAIGGRGNKAQVNGDTALGGDGNVVKGGNATSVGGWNNSVTAYIGLAAGGCNNIAGPGTLSTYDGCPADYVNSSGWSWPKGSLATVMGGKFNQATGTLSLAAGGESNSTAGRHGSVLGGWKRQQITNNTMVGGNEYHVRVKAGESGTVSTQSGGSTKWKSWSYSDGVTWINTTDISDISKCSATATPVTAGGSMTAVRQATTYKDWLLFYTYSGTTRKATDLDIDVVCDF